MFGAEIGAEIGANGQITAKIIRYGGTVLSDRTTFILPYRS
jgi:hypothetical protein